MIEEVEFNDQQLKNLAYRIDQQLYDNTGDVEVTYLTFYNEGKRHPDNRFRVFYKFSREPYKIRNGSIFCTFIQDGAYNICDLKLV